ncbi:MAG TPA: hypothetical protein VGG04_15540 [Candidatus Sulfotelmatobacter sp.]|jgi:hypothetical protein
MDREKFLASLKTDSPPPSLPLALAALWWDAKGNWSQAHEDAQQDNGQAGAWVHAYLHRKEGDVSNADYWYARAGKRRPQAASELEWQEIVDALFRDLPIP